MYNQVPVEQQTLMMSDHVVVISLSTEVTHLETTTARPDNKQNRLEINILMYMCIILSKCYFRCHKYCYYPDRGRKYRTSVWIERYNLSMKM